jgi:hypothetical protein
VDGGGWVALLVLATAIWLSVKYWTISVPILVGIAIVSFVACVIHIARKRTREVDQEQDARLIRREEAKLEHAKRQTEVRQHAIGLIAAANELRKAVSYKACSASAALDQAEAEFTERAFAPFWTAVETAANCLASVDEAVREMGRKRKSYCADVSQLDSSPPPFEVAVSSLSNVVGIADRMHGIVRAAQKDFQFATIFEQRKTNQLLVHGFGSLASALVEMSSRLENSLSALEWELFDSTEVVRGIERKLGSS